MNENKVQYSGNGETFTFVFDEIGVKDYMHIRDKKFNFNDFRKDESIFKRSYKNRDKV